MTDVTEELQALRAALTRGEEPREGPVPSGTVQVVRRPGGPLDHVRVTLPSPIDLDELAPRFGSPAFPPRTPAGRRLAHFRDTSPGDGEFAVTVLAELDGTGRAVVVVLRPDDLR